MELLLALSATALGLALHLNDGLYSPAAVGLLGLALLLCVGGVVGRFRTTDPTTLRIALAVLVIGQMVAMMLKRAGASEVTVPVVDQRPFQIVVACAMALVLALAVAGRKTTVVCFVTLLAIHAAIGVWKLRTAPAPKIDVFIFQTDAPRALMQGVNPYTITFENIYGPDTRVYAPGVVQEGRLQFGYPYPPLTLLLTAPAQILFGDFRYAQLLAMLLIGVFIALIRPDSVGMLAAALLLFTPRCFYVLESGWTEPLSAMLLAATVLCAVRFPRALPVALGLLLASKQYLPAAILLAWHGFPTQAAEGHGLETRATIRLMLIAVLVAVGVSLPLVLWNVDAFLHSAVTLQLRQPYRSDALSFLGWWGSSRPDWTGPFWVAFVALAIGVMLSWWRKPGFAAAFALSFLCFFAFNKQAFA
ncbi:MAG TPA: hypothetical protein VH518_08160, partial [Tepidisphaeraceae bacterium]